MTEFPADIYSRPYGVKASTFMGDPRVNKAQMVAITQAVESDPDARIVGLDHKLRPVIRARVGIPKGMRKWAIMRNGDPTEAGKVKERWS